MAEEGLDIPDCNVIIRFDLYDTLIQYIQSRGRARQDGSEYIHMVEQFNTGHQLKMEFTKKHEQALRRFCEAMPEDRKLAGNDLQYGVLSAKRRQPEAVYCAINGSKAQLQAKYCLSRHLYLLLATSTDTVFVPEFVITKVEGGFQCEVILPRASPVTRAMGRVQPSKAVAKCSAAFKLVSN